MNEKNGPFRKEFNELIDNFGYEWEIEGKQIILDMQRKNQTSQQYEQFSNKPMRYFLTVIGINEGSLRGKRLVKAYLCSKGNNGWRSPECSAAMDGTLKSVQCLELHSDHWNEHIGVYGKGKVKMNVI